MSSKGIIRENKDSAVSEIIGYILVFSLAVVLIGTSILIYVPDSGTANDLNYQASALNSIENLQTSLINSGAQTGTQYYENIPMGIQSSFFGQNTPTSVSYLSNSNYSYSYGLKLGVQVEGYNGNTAYNKVIGSIYLGYSSKPDSIVFDQSNGNLYAASYYGGPNGRGNISVISSSTDKVIGSISLPAHPYTLAYDSFNNYLIVSMYSSSGHGCLETIDIATGTVVAFQSSSYVFYDIAYDSASGDLLVASTQNSRSIEIFNASTLLPIETVTPPPAPNSSLDTIPSALTYDSANGIIYVAGGDNVWALNGVTYKLVFYYALYSPWNIAFDTYNGNVYASADTVSGSGCLALVPSEYTCEVYVFNGTSSTLENTATTPYSPIGMIYDPANREIYVTDYFSDKVSVFNGMDPMESCPIQNLTVGSGPGAGFNPMVYDPANGNVYVLNFRSGNISVIQGNTVLGKGWKIANGGLPLSYGFNGTGSVAVTGPTNFVKQYTYSLEDGSVLETDTSGNGRNESALPFIFNLTSGYLGFTSNLVNFGGSGNIQIDTNNPTSVTLTLLNFSGMTIYSGEILTIVNSTTGSTLNIKVLNIYLCDFTYSFTSPLYKAWAYSFYNTYTASGASFSSVDSLSTWAFKAPFISATVSGDTVTFHSTSEIILYAITLGYYDYNVQIIST